MAEQLPAPGLRFGRLAEQAKNVGPFAQHLRPANQVAEEAVELHNVAGDLVTLAAQTRAQHRHDRGLRRHIHFVEAKPVMLDIKFGVLPVPPELRIDWKAHGAPLRWRQAGEQIVDRSHHGRRRRILRLQRKQIGLDVTVRGQAFERRRAKFCPSVEQFPGARILHARLRVRARCRSGDGAVPRYGYERPIIGTVHF